MTTRRGGGSKISTGGLTLLEGRGVAPAASDFAVPLPIPPDVATAIEEVHARREAGRPATVQFLIDVDDVDLREEAIYGFGTGDLA